MSKTSVRIALRDAIMEEMIRDQNILLMGEEVGEYQGAYKVTEGLLKKFGNKRIIDTPISEHAFTGIAIGASMIGLKPIVEFMSFNFAMQAIDQIINSASKIHYMSGGNIHCPIVFRGPNGAASRVGAQHSQCYASWYAHIPGLKVIAPYTASDHKNLLQSAIRDPNPVIFLEHELLYNQVGDIDNQPITIGKAKVIRRGTDLTIATFSIQVKNAMDAADILLRKGYSIEIIDLRSIRPLDIETIIESVKKTNKLLCIEEGWHFSGIGSEISAEISERCFDYLDVPIYRISAKDVPLPYAANLEKDALPNVQDIIEKVQKIIQ